MSQRKVSFVSGEYYHVYNRGNSKQKIFLDENDYLRFIGLLFVCNSSKNFKIDNFSKKENLLNFLRDKEIVNIGSYCLMPNHFHILITEIGEGNISRFMQKLSTAYAMYFNKKYQRSGSLFEGKFKAEHASSDKYLKYLFSYINLNPVKLIEPKWKEQGIKNRAKFLDYLNKYSYSSYQDYIGKTRIENKILNKSMFPEYFINREDFEREIFDWINFNR